MGRDKTGQRVKGNLRPSDSGRTAELLGLSGSAPNVFVGFSSASQSDDLDGNLAVIVKKLDKRDVTTKQKAIEELLDELDTIDEDSARKLLAYWPPLYARSSIEADRRVRLAINVAHAKLLTLAKRNAAPHLKILMGSWLNSMFDPNRDIARVATEAFNTLFGDKKRGEVLVFCLADIVQYIVDNVVIKKPETLSDPRYTSVEDIAFKYSRVISGCFYTLVHLFENLERTSYRTALPELEKLYATSEFWDKCHYNDLNIRNSFYKLIIVTASKEPELFKPQVENLRKIFFSRAFEEKEVSTHQNVWDAVLVSSKVYPELWAFNNVSEYQKNLFQFIKFAGYGSAMVSYPSMVVLLSILPTNITSGSKFYRDYFAAFWSGLSQETVDITAASVFFRSLFECLVFFLKTEKSKPDLCKDIFVDYFQRVFKLYLLPHTLKSIQEKVNEYQLRNILANFVNKVYQQSILDVSILDENIYASIEQLLLSPLADLKMADFAGVSKRCGLFFEACFAKSVDKTRLEVHLRKLEREAMSQLLTGASANRLGYLTFLSHSSSIERASAVELDTAASASITELVIQSDNAKEAFPHFLRILSNKFKASSIGLNAYWEPVFSATLKSTLDTCTKLEILALVYSEMILDSANLDKLRTEAVEPYLTSVLQSKNDDATNGALYRLFEVLFNFSEGLSGAILKTLIGRISSVVRAATLAESRQVSEPSEVYQCVSLIRNDLSRTHFLLKHSDLSAELAEMFYEVVCLLASPLRDSDSFFAMLAAVWKGFCQLEQAELSSKLIETHLSCLMVSDETLTCQHFAEAAHLLCHDLLKDNCHNANLSKLIGSSETWSSLISAASCSSPFLFLLDALAPDAPKVAVPSPLLGRLIVVAGLLLEKFNLEKLVFDLSCAHSDDPQVLGHVVNFVCATQLINDHTALATNSLLSHGMDTSLLGRVRQTFMTFSDGIYVTFGAEGFNLFQDIISAQSSMSLLSLSTKKMTSSAPHVARSWRLLLDGLFATTSQLPDSCLASMLEFVKSPNNDIPYWFAVFCSALSPLLSFSDRLKLVSALVEKIDSLEIVTEITTTLLVLLSANFGYAVKAPAQDISISFQDATKLLDLISNRTKASYRELALLETIAAHPSFLENTHWTRMFDYCQAQLKSLPADEEAYSDYVLALHFYLRVLYASESLSNPSDKFSEGLEALNATGAQTVFDAFISLDKTPLKGHVKLQYENFLSALIERIPAEVIRREWTYEQLLVPFGMANQEIQKAAYKLLHDLSVEQISEMSKALDMLGAQISPEQNKAVLPAALIDALRHGIDEENTSKTLELKYLLCCMVLMDFFEESSFKLKNEYVDHLLETGVLGNILLTLFGILGVYSSQKKPVDLSKWDVEFFDILGLDAESKISIPLLASHLYWKMLKHIPSAVRLWFVECKNRQLTMAVESFTEKYFGHLIIRNETGSMETIDKAKFGSSLTVKTIRGTVSNEIVAAYRVDENDLEICIRIPNSYPLKQVEIEGLQRIGVTEDRWRRWLLNCNVILASQNGTIADAILVWKQNAEKHFEGVEECAICYSVIGTLDRNLPTKQCKTCKHYFHSGCLFKWFRTSNNSSCPLCRNLF